MIATEVCRFSQDSVCIGVKCPMFKKCTYCSKTRENCDKLKAVYDKDLLDVQYEILASDVCHKCKEN